MPSYRSIDKHGVWRISGRTRGGGLDTYAGKEPGTLPPYRIQFRMLLSTHSPF